MITLIMNRLEKKSPIKLYMNVFKVEDPDGKAWCSTKVDANLNHIHGRDHWGYCGQECFLAESDEQSTVRQVTLTKTFSFS